MQFVALVGRILLLSLAIIVSRLLTVADGGIPVMQQGVGMIVILVTLSELMRLVALKVPAPSVQP
jgi:hypothetical protein